MEKVRREKMQVREKVGKSLNTVFPMFCGSGGPRKMWMDPKSSNNILHLHILKSEKDVSGVSVGDSSQNNLKERDLSVPKKRKGDRET